MKKIKKRIIALALASLVSVPTLAFADNYIAESRNKLETYSGILLPKLSGNYYLGNRTKTTNDTYYQHKVTRLGGNYKAVKVWAQNALETDRKVQHNVGVPLANVSFTKSTFIKGSTYRLNLENATATTVRVEATGNYNTR